jgi:hypothetical protein
MEPWYKVTQPRQEVREGRSFSPDEFAIALEQVVAGTAPEDYRDPAKFFVRNCFTRALREHSGMVLRRLAGKTENTSPVMTLITQFGGGKTHTLTTLYHLARNGEKARVFDGVADLLQANGISEAPQARVGVFVGNAWDPQAGRETPWIDLAQQLAGDEGVMALGESARSAPPGTDALARLFAAAGGRVLILFDEVLNFVNRHRHMADGFHAFIQNLTVAMTGNACGAAVISLPRSQVEMTDWDMQWQEKITKVVRRVAKDLIANDEAEISEVVRRRLFEDIGSERIRRNVARAYADWCFERRAQLPPEWTAVDTASTETKAREYLQSRFEACFPFHPATLSVFQRKWQALPQFQQTRGTLAMLAQWISWAYRDGYSRARRESLITLGSAPLDVPEFRSSVLGQLGEARLQAAIEADISGQQSHARALDADTKGALKDIHRRVGATILFESSGGQRDKLAHLPELRFALGDPDIDTTTIDNAAAALESHAFFIRRVGTDGFQIRHQPTLKKVVSDRRASLDEESEIKPAMRDLVEQEFKKGTSLPLILSPNDGTEIPDSTKLTLVIMRPETEWTGNGALRSQIAEWTRYRGKSPRLYPGAIVWCFKKPGRDLRDKVELWLAWKRVMKDVASGILGDDFDRSEKADIQTNVKDAEEKARDEVWGGYRFVVIADQQELDGLKIIDLGAGHASGADSLCGRIITALKSQALLNESVGAGYLERNWPPALKESGAWPLASLRQSFLNGSLTRLLDPDAVLRNKIVEFVSRGDFGLASGSGADGAYERVGFEELIAPEEVYFEPGVFLLTKVKAKTARKALETGEGISTAPNETGTSPPPIQTPVSGTTAIKAEPEPSKQTETVPSTITLRLVGTIPSEAWNRFGTKILPKLRGNGELKLGIDCSVSLSSEIATNLASELKQILSDLGLENTVKVENSK